LPTRLLPDAAHARPAGSAHRRGAALARNRRGGLSFFDRDHGDGRSPSKAARWPGWTNCCARRHHDATGEVWLHCYPRVLGYTFKPVSFWYCHRARPMARLRAIVVEVNNTFGERHCYLLDRPRYGAELTARKVFHVSPFCEVEGATTSASCARPRRDGRRAPWRASTTTTPRPAAADQRQRHAEAGDAADPAPALWRYPAMTLGVIAASTGRRCAVAQARGFPPKPARPGPVTRPVERAAPFRHPPP
jgi:DUF1365 family protein